MNVLVTNTHSSQSYAIIRALRPYAHKIVATMEGGNRFLARLAQAANSQLVDKRFYVSLCRRGLVGWKHQAREHRKRRSFYPSIGTNL